MTFYVFSILAIIALIEAILYANKERKDWYIPFCFLPFFYVFMIFIAFLFNYLVGCVIMASLEGGAIGVYFMEYGWPKIERCR